MSVAKLIDRIAQTGSRMNGAHTLAVVCALYETMIVTRLLFVPVVANSTLRAAMIGNSWAMPVFVLIVIVAVAGIWFCRRWPLKMLLLEMVLLLIASTLYGSAFSYLSLPWAIALYFAAAGIENLLLRICGLVAAGLLGLGSVGLATIWHHDAGFTNFLYPFVLLYVVFVAAGVLVRSYRKRLQSLRALHDEQKRGEKLIRERDKAMSQSRIAAELHDSVGHDLTAIIALSEGLDGMDDKPETNDAIGMINDLARQGLKDTRTAVRALQSSEHADGDKSVNQENNRSKRNAGGVAENGILDNYISAPSAQVALHNWDDINPILDHSRQIGITVALTETGRRPQDSQQADLSFVITRESITNAIRHGQEIDRIIVSWDHNEQGGITIAVRDNGQLADRSNQSNDAEKNSMVSSNQKDRTNFGDFKQNSKAKLKSTEYGDGTGLVRLRKRVEREGGTFAVGPDTDGWMVKAYIPSLVVSADKQLQGGDQK